MTEVRFQCRLQIRNALADESHRLLIFASREKHSHACFNEIVLITEEEFQFSYSKADKEPPEWLHFVLFANHLDKDQILFQSLLAWGNLQWCKAGTATLVDVKNNTQAVLQIRSEDCAAMTTTPSALLPSADAAIAQVRRAYEALVHETDSYLNWVVTPMGKVPVLPFVASVASILTDSPADHERGEEFLLHQFNLAGVNTGFKAIGWKRCTAEQKAQWLVETVTLMPRAMIYQQDTVRVGEGKADKAADQWVQLLSFPEPNLAGFDCEDSAILTLELLYMIQHLPFASAMLRDVQEFTKPYTACFIFGTLKIDGAFAPHAYSALLDASFLNGDTPKSSHPAILFEGTARIGGSWADDRKLPDINESFQTHATALENLGHGKGYSRVMRGEASMELVKERGIYGPVYGVISGDHGSHAVHLLLHSKGSSRIGVEPQQLYDYDPSVCFQTALQYKKDNATFKQMCKELPRSHIPYVSSSKMKLHENKGQFHIDVHYETYVTREEQIRIAMDKTKGSKYKVKPQVLHITDQLKVQQLWFDSS